MVRFCQKCNQKMGREPKNWQICSKCKVEELTYKKIHINERRKEKNPPKTQRGLPL